jgi:hypothetical protein
MFEFLDRLAGNKRDQRLTMDQLALQQAQMQGQQGPQQPAQGQPVQPVSLDTLAAPKRKGGLSLDSLSQGLNDVSGKVGDFLTGDNYRRNSLGIAENIGRLNRQGEMQKALTLQNAELGKENRGFNRDVALESFKASLRPAERERPGAFQTIQEGRSNVTYYIPPDAGGDRSKWQKVGGGPKDAPNTENGLADNKFSLELGGKWFNESKDYFGAKQAYNSVLAANDDPGPAGDIALIFAFMKTLDPGSTVREGEFATAESAGSVSDSIWNRYNRVLKGERLGETRSDFVNQARLAFERKRKQQEIVNGRWQRKATAYGVNPNLVVDLEEMAMPESGVFDKNAYLGSK